MGASSSTTGSDGSPPPYDPSGTMRAVTFAEVGKVLVEDVPRPSLPLAPGEAIVRVSVAGICGSDLHPLNGHEPCDVGTVFGHEAVGIVVALGAADGSGAGAGSSLPLGTRVVVPFTTVCGDCYFCLSGLSARCVSAQLLGWRLGGAGLHGCQAEYVRVPLAASSLLPLPRDLHDEEGLLLGDVWTTALFAAASAGLAGASPDASGSPLGALRALLASARLGEGPAGEADSLASEESEEEGEEAEGASAASASGGSPALTARAPPRGAPPAIPALAIGAPQARGEGGEEGGAPAGGAPPPPPPPPPAVRLLAPPVYVVLGCGPVGLLAIAAARTLLSLRGWGWGAVDGGAAEGGVVESGAAEGSVVEAGAAEAGAAEVGGAGTRAAGAAGAPGGRAPPPALPLAPLIFAVDRVPERLAAAARVGAAALDLGALGEAGVLAAVRAASAGRADWMRVARDAAAAAAAAAAQADTSAATAADTSAATAAAPPAAPPAPAPPAQLRALGDGGAMASLSWHGAGADAVMECVGGGPPLALACALARPGATVASIGVHTQGAWPITPGGAYDKNLTLRAGRCPVRSLMPAALALMRLYKARAAQAAPQGAPCPPLRALVFSHRLPLAKAARAYAMFNARKAGCVKVALYTDPSLIPQEAE